ncbi:MAG: DUF1800 domain-containing protein [Gammaproteobacteria bacterium]|nr:DUF1800 domain-containing protein [Gammaproteobacteria bacterium]
MSAPSLIKSGIKIFVLTVTAVLAACGGGGGGGSSTSVTAPPTASAPPVSKAEAFRFLNQATFGATEAEANRLIALGDSNNAYSRWIDQQIGREATLLLPAVEAAYPDPIPANFNIAVLNGNRLEQWFSNALRGEDQLRQRVAFALSEIFVVSQVGALLNLPNATADFHDMLARGAFGNFRTLLENVTLHPAMGIYLSMLGNQRAVANTNLRPDENYAREMMQLFSVGLVQLNIDGTVRNDASGQPLPTYNQDIIEGFARVFTGWKWECPTTLPACTFATTRPQLAPVAGYNQVRPMRLYADFHETGTKLVLNYSGVTLPNATIPAGQSGTQDLQDALDNVFNHPNVGPFIAKQLIQRLVTSNPSPAYVQRIAEKFNNDGAGRRGNLEAVVKAILLDAEARNPASGTAAASAGKLKEPLLRLTQFWRAYEATSRSGRLGVAANFSGGVGAVFGQAQGSSPSVFNFFSPFYAPPGEIADSGRVSPEMQIATEYLNTQIANFFWTQAVSRTHTATNLAIDLMYINTAEELTAANDSEALINRVAERLLGGSTQISATLKAQAKAQIDRTVVPATNPATALATRTADAIFFVTTSPEFALQR